MPATVTQTPALGTSPDAVTPVAGATPGGAGPPVAAGQPVAAAPALTGRLRERYQLRGLLRTVGGTQIWLAVDEKLSRTVAVYLMSSGDRQVPALLDAARGAATVPDTRFLQVLDAVDDGTTAYVVTEWTQDAVDVARILASGPLPSWEATRVAAELAEAMASAHALGQAHLRLDPATVLRTGSEQVKIQGLRLEAALAGVDQPAPVEAEIIDVRAVGALLYATLTGFWPFGGAFGLPPAPLDGGVPRSPSRLVPGVSEQLGELALRMLLPGSDIAGPPLSCGEAAAELARLPRPAPRRPVPPVLEPAERPRFRSADDRQPGGGRTGARAVLPLAAVTLIVAGLGVFGVQYFGGASNPPATATHTSASAKPPASPAAVPLDIQDASLWQSSFTDEHSAEVPNTLAGKGGGWTTFGYRDGPRMLIKPGTGIIYDLGSVRDLRSATVRIGTPGATLEMWAADPELPGLPAMRRSAPPGFQRVATQDATSTTVTLAASEQVRTRYVLIWFTSLPRQATTRGTGGPFYDSIIKVSLFG